MVRKVSYSTRALVQQALLVAAITGLVGGCGTGGGQLPTAKVAGKVSFDGKPVGQGTVMFVPDGNGPPATGELTQDGSFSLKTYADGDGAVIGKHKVSITALEGTGDALPEAKAASLPKMLIPEKYNNHTTSGLTFDVVADKANVADFSLAK